MVLNIGNIVVSLQKLLVFLISQDHNVYNDLGRRAFDGLTAPEKAAQLANMLP